jgi:carboxylesterase type B
MERSFQIIHRRKFIGATADGRVTRSDSPARGVRLWRAPVLPSARDSAFPRRASRFGRAVVLSMLLGALLGVLAPAAVATTAEAGVDERQSHGDKGTRAPEVRTLDGLVRGERSGGVDGDGVDGDKGTRAPEVRTQDGPVRGERIGEVDAFRGIPYAAPPVGMLRFAPPARVTPWTGTLDATGLTPPCPQFASSNGPQSLNENCLLLDVWRPRHSRDFWAGEHFRRARPVLFWIHGGGDAHGGNGSASQHDPSQLVQDTNTIVVTINYRVGAFGFLALPALDAEQRDVSGNAGLLDQQAALRWVHDNIARFGGDPDNVTVAGESAGGWGVCAQLVSPRSRGMFAHVIIQSATCSVFRTQDAALAQGKAVAQSLGCSVTATAAACMRGKDALTLMTAWQGSEQPVVGGRALPVQPGEAIDSGRYNKVPVMYGNTFDELSFIILGNPQMSQEELRQGLAAIYPDHAQAVLAEYGGIRPPAWAFSAARNDPFICGMNDLAGRLSKSTAVWYYEFNDQTPPPEIGVPIELRAVHGSELQYLFDFRRSDGSLKYQRGLDAAEQRLSNQMIHTWAAFVADGNPNHRESLYWPPFRLNNAHILRFAPDNTRVIAGTAFAADHHCGFWKSLGVVLDFH